MPRLVTFGCSFVFGHGLPDCYMPPVNPGNTPSKFAWPQILADKLGYECYNLSRCGSGNFEILMRILSTEFRSDDLVLIAWSYFHRFEQYKITDMEANWRKIGFEDPEYKTMLSYQAEIKNTDTTLHYYNWLTIQHAELFLNSKNIKNNSYIGVYIRPQYPIKTIPKYITVNNYIPDIHLVHADLALDGVHPGLESHRLQADLIYSKIIDRIK